mmetsp:Transcript_32637/g.75126  ORF Transcript_32637/g.75126 Transcript_32637/m.75126 type:complete len:585 (-) Transcript_32637:411-2165(-)
MFKQMPVVDKRRPVGISSMRTRFFLIFGAALASAELCIVPKNQVIPCGLAGFTCSAGGDSNDGSTNKQNCEGKGGQWTPYSCPDANSYLSTQSPELKEILVGWWRGKCCESPTPDPPDGTMCHDPETELNGVAPAGFSCIKDSEPIGDSNDFTTTEASCTSAGGAWVPYNCQNAQNYYNSISESQGYFACWWAFKCCVPVASPTSSPVKPPIKSGPGPSPAPTKNPTNLSPTPQPSDRSYCTRDDAICWPTDAELNDLDTQIRGKVMSVPADGSTYGVCFDQGDDAFKLTEAGNGLCYQYHDCRYQFCRAESGENDLQLPGVIVQPFDADDASKALKFASDHNMAVTIKTSGHSFMGSSTGKDTLQIVTTELDENDETKLLPANSWSNSCPSTGPVKHVLRAGGGSFWKQGYLAAGFGVNVVGGGALSVSVAGGWLQGGGLSAMTPTHGLGVDNVLAFDVVLADGSLVVADECSHPDLFWALRGGGGGTFGVVTKIHYRAHSNPTNSRYVACRVSFQSSDNTIRESMTDAWIDFMVDKSATGIDRRWGGYWNLLGSITSCKRTTHSLLSYCYFQLCHPLLQKIH